MNHRDDPDNFKFSAGARQRRRIVVRPDDEPAELGPWRFILCLAVIGVVASVFAFFII